MIANISTGPSDSFHRDEQNPGQDQAHFQYPFHIRVKLAEVISDSTNSYDPLPRLPFL